MGATRKPPTNNTDAFAQWCAEAVPDGVSLSVTTHRYFNRKAGSNYNNIITSISVCLGDHVERHEHHSLEILAQWLLRIGIPRLFPQQLVAQPATVKATVKPRKPPVGPAAPKLTHAVRALPAPVPKLPVIWH
jgi:hypothetical protein